MRLSGLREQQQTRDHALDSSKLVDGHSELRAVARLTAMEVEVAARDRHRGSELVGNVVQKTVVAHHELLGGTHRRLPATCVPHHCEEHRRHQRHFEQLAPKLDSFERVDEDRRAGG